jgi:hypothetical protein
MIQTSWRRGKTMGTNYTVLTPSNYKYHTLVVERKNGKARNGNRIFLRKPLGRVHMENQGNRRIIQ